MGLKNLISSMLTLLLAPNNVIAKASEATGSTNNTAAADVGTGMQLRHSPAAAECAVCLSSLKGGAGTTVLPCRHEFHADCVERWLAVPHFKNTCPICRFLMEEECCELRRRRQQECFTEEMVIWFSSFHVAGF